MRSRRCPVARTLLIEAAVAILLAAPAQASELGSVPAGQEELLDVMRSQEQGVDSLFNVDREVLARLFQGRPRTTAPGPAAGEVYLNGRRVKVEISWRNYYVSPPQAGSATGLQEGDDFAFFYFFTPANPEVFVKVLDSTDPTRFGVYFAALSDLEWTITLTVVCTGESVTRTMPFQSYNAGANGQLTRAPLANCPKEPYTASGVASLNGLTGAVTLTPGSNVSISPTGNSLVISATPGGGGVTSVSAGAGLTGGGTGSVTLSVANQGISTAMLQDGSVTAAKIAPGASPSYLAVCTLTTGITVNVPQSPGVAQGTVVPFNTCNPGEGITGTGSPSFRYTVPSTGTYQVNAKAALHSSAAGGFFDLAILRNGSWISVSRVILANADTIETVQAHEVVRLSAGDTIWVAIAHCCGGTRPLWNDGAPWDTFTIARTGD